MAEDRTVRRRDVVGGQRVRVRAGERDETFPRHLLGRVGRIRGIDSGEFGTPESDPFVIVAFDGIGRDGFWLEELEVVP